MNKDKPVDKIIKGNKAIAEFMGGKLKYYNLSNEPYYQLNKQQWMPERLVYHTSWDWLLPSWSKLSSLLLEKEAFDLIEEFKNAVVNVDINAAWNVVVKGINLINEKV